MKVYVNSFILLLISIKPTLTQNSNCSSVGDPLLVTPLLLNGSYIQAQKLCKVTPSIGNITSYSGFFTVNKTCNSNIFFWFFPALTNWTQAPLVIWLQGGPGSSSMYGLFEEIGPYVYNGSLKRRKCSWNNVSNLLFIDQPVGSGYSFTNNVTGCYPSNESEVGRDLYQAIAQFYKLFPIFVENNNSLFITGESYAGHWIPAIVHTIIEKNVNASLKINITSVLIGGAWVHPIVQCINSQLLYYLGFYDRAAQLIDVEFEQDFLEDMRTGNYTDAALICGAQLGSIFEGLAGENISVYNYVKLLNDEGNYKDFVQSCEIRKALHVGNSTFQSGLEIQKYLYEDLVISVKPWVEEALENNITFIFINGNLDVIGNYVLLEEVLRNLTWSGQTNYLNATRTKWCVDGIEAGLFKGNKLLFEAMFRSAGHYIPKDQPEWAYLLFRSVITGAPYKPFHLLETCDQTNIT